MMKSKPYPLLLIAFLISPPTWSLDYDYDKIVQGFEELGEHDAAYPFAYDMARQQNTYQAWRDVAAKYTNIDSKAFMQAWKHADEQKDKSTYEDFLKIRPNSRLNLHAIHAIFELTKNLNTIADYQRFMEEFPDTVESVVALLEIHKLAFERAKQDGNSLTYDAFVTTFPGAKKIPDAIDFAYKAEEKEIKTELKALEEDLRKNYKGKGKGTYFYKGRPLVESCVELIIDNKADYLLNEAKKSSEKNNKLKAARKYSLLELEIFKSTETVTKNSPPKGENKQLKKKKDTEIEDRISDIKSSLVKTFERQMLPMKSTIVTVTQKLEDMIDTRNSFLKQQLDQIKQSAENCDTSFERSLTMPYESGPSLISYELKIIKDALEKPTPGQTVLFSLKK